jgi:hypothetical protein
MKDGTEIDCSAEELVQLKHIGLFGDNKPIIQEKKENVIYTKKPNHVYITNKHFTRADDKLIKEVWNTRKNNVRLTRKEYLTLEKLIPHRTRKAISARLFRLRHTHKLL